MITVYGYEINVMASLLTVFIVWCFIEARRLNSRSDNTFEILDLLMENGRISKAAVVMIGAFILTTWMMVTLTLKDKLTEGYLGIYVAAWITPVVVRLITGTPSNPNKAEAPPSTPPATPNQLNQNG